MDPVVPSWLVEYWLLEDVQVGDLTTSLLGIRGPGAARVVTRERIVVSCCEEAARVYETVGARIGKCAGTGSRLDPGSTVLEAVGDVSALHKAWRTAQEIIAFCSGISTKAERLVEKARRENPRVVVVSTRKTYPGLRLLMVKAASAGGVLPHRSGLSDSILVFDNHVGLLGGPEELASRVAELKAAVPTRKLAVEASGLEEALLYARSGADVVQLDHVGPGEVKEFVWEIRRASPSVLVAVAGGIDEDNIAEYAASGVDMVVTSAPYHARPADLTTIIKRLGSQASF